MKLYIAGPMTGYPEFNYPAFMAAEVVLHELGFDTLNPARTPECASWDGYMRASLALVVQADGIAVLDDWELSAGAVLEVHVAQALRMPVHRLGQWVLGARSA